jgi:hypothetical protein
VEDDDAVALLVARQLGRERRPAQQGLSEEVERLAV